MIHLPSQSRNHAECAVPENPEYIIYFIYYREISFCANFPSS